MFILRPELICFYLSNCLKFVKTLLKVFDSTMDFLSYSKQFLHLISNCANLDLDLNTKSVLCFRNL